ncbi:MAG: MaoC/PaaZ C-terminal domain-containing protein [Nocardioides sp.]
MPVPIMLKAALPSVPVVNQLPGVRKNGGDPSSLHELRSATVTAEHVQAYAAVCGFAVRETAPLTYPHVLAFPLHMAVMTSPAFPFPAIGTIHLDNAITQHRPVTIGETLQLEVHATPARPHPKGTAIDFLSRALVGEETVWESSSTYLRRGRPDPDAEAAPPGSRPDHVVPGRVTWSLGGDVGRRYAAVSGDHNPIHLYAITARAFGFRRQIAHGMWSLARCVAAVENRLPDAVTVEASFRKPVFLPSTVAFGQDSTADGIDFALSTPRTGAAHVVGRTRAPA